MNVRYSAIAALIAFLLGLAVATFSELRIFLPALLRGAAVTIEISILSAILFFSMSFIAGIGRLNSIRPIRWISTIYIEVFRGTSLLVILFWFFFVLPSFGVVLSPTQAAVLGLGLNFGAYGAEVVRGAITAVPKGQKEASAALNLPDWKSTLRIVIPQAIPIAIPGLSNLTIEMIKATALVSAVTLVDITFASVQQNQIHYRTLDIFIVAMVIYYCFSQLIRFGGAILEARMTRHLARPH
ncbi:MAG: ectoine/hydroxyectoine ABC transporter permease subunit EhuC [Albidovulum sp.]|nr:ectoine/hydroxyectoine ABC transporter permease subunit EhuC [Albidovulum sp.]